MVIDKEELLVTSKNNKRKIHKIHKELSTNQEDCKLRQKMGKGYELAIHKRRRLNG